MHDVTLEDCEHLIEAYEKCPDIKQQKLLSDTGKTVLNTK